MARPLRLEYPGALWHVTNRGVEKRIIYLDNEDRRRFLRILVSTVREYGWQLIVWVLMSNHYHLLFQTPQTNLSRGMKDLDGDYATSFNQRYGRTGHLFEGRFDGRLVDSDTYLLEVARYDVLNPVRARMVQSPEQWRWSSYRATAGLEPVPDWLDTAPIMERLGGDDRQATYREFVRSAVGLNVSPWQQMAARAFLGGPAFLREVEKKILARKCSDEHPRPQRAFRAATLESVKAAVQRLERDVWPPAPGSDARVIFILLACRRTTANRAEIGRYLELTGQRVGQMLRAGIERLATDPALVRMLTAAEESLPEIAG